MTTLIDHLVQIGHRLLQLEQSLCRQSKVPASPSASRNALLDPIEMLTKILESFFDGQQRLHEEADAEAPQRPSPQASGAPAVAVHRQPQPRRGATLGESATTGLEAASLPATPRPEIAAMSSQQRAGEPSARPVSLWQDIQPDVSFPETFSAGQTPFSKTTPAPEGETAAKATLPSAFAREEARAVAPLPETAAPSSLPEHASATVPGSPAVGLRAEDTVSLMPAPTGRPRFATGLQPSMRSETQEEASAVRPAPQGAVEPARATPSLPAPATRPSEKGTRLAQGPSSLQALLQAAVGQTSPSPTPPTSLPVQDAPRPDAPAGIAQPETPVPSTHPETHARSAFPDQQDQIIETLVDQLELALLRTYGTSGS